MTIEDFRKELETRKAKQQVLQSTADGYKKQIEGKGKHLSNLRKARWLLSEAARATQKNVKGYIESLGTMAIRSVFGDRDFKFVVDFEIKRNKSECLLRVQEGDWEPYVPKDDEGGGIIDIISFALRVILWSMMKPKSRNVFILDEPMKFVGKGELLRRAGEMIRSVSHKLGFQLILLTHEPELIEIADRAWTVKHNGTMSEVEEIKAVVIQPTERRSSKLRITRIAVPKSELIKEEKRIIEEEERKNAGIAQSVEHSPTRVGVVGSKPTARSKLIKRRKRK